VVAHKNAVPTFELDFWSDEVILDAYPHYEALRELGPAVWLSKNQVWALTHYASVREALVNPAVFSSAKGCMVNQPMNDATQGIMLCSDDPDHQQMGRKAMAQRMRSDRLGDARRVRCLGGDTVHLPVGLVTVLRRSPISLRHLGFECERADAAQI
jgi:cytochrome P450